VTSVPPRIVRRAALIGGGAALALVAVYAVAVRTAAGQRYEDATLRAAEGAHPNTVLAWYSMAAALAIVVAIAAARRRPGLALGAVAVMAACVLTTEVVQRSLVRPVLLRSGYRREDQGFPSGHAAIAAAVVCALAIVVPYRWRLWALVPASLWAGAVAVATVDAGWHRPSDTVGSDLIALLYACAAIAVLARRGPVRPSEPAHGVVLAIYALGAAAALAGAAVASPLTAGRLIALSGTLALVATLLLLAGGFSEEPTTPHR